MSIALIKDNSITYPTDVFRNYNIYLINEYEKYLKNTENENVILKVKKIIDELQELLRDNTEPISIDKIFNVMDWEEHLNYHFKRLDVSLKYRNKKSILTIEMFLRKEKLKKLK